MVINFLFLKKKKKKQLFLNVFNIQCKYMRIFLLITKSFNSFKGLLKMQHFRNEYFLLSTICAIKYSFK